MKDLIPTMHAFIDRGNKGKPSELCNQASPVISSLDHWRPTYVVPEGHKGQDLLSPKFQPLRIFFFKYASPPKWGFIDFPMKFIAHTYKLGSGMQPSFYNLSADPHEQVNLMAFTDRNSSFEPMMNHFQHLCAQWHLLGSCGVVERLTISQSVEFMSVCSKHDSQAPHFSRARTVLFGYLLEKNELLPGEDESKFIPFENERINPMEPSISVWTLWEQFQIDEKLWIEFISPTGILNAWDMEALSTWIVTKNIFTPKSLPLELGEWTFRVTSMRTSEILITKTFLVTEDAPLIQQQKQK